MCEIKNADEAKPVKTQLVENVIYSLLSQQQERIRREIEGLRTDERKVATFDKFQAETYEDKMLVNDVLDVILRFDSLNSNETKI